MCIRDRTGVLGVTGNSTFGGSLTDMVRFKIILETIRDFDLLNNAKNNGNYLLNKINDLENLIKTATEKVFDSGCNRSKIRTSLIPTKKHVRARNKNPRSKPFLNPRRRRS